MTGRELELRGPRLPSPAETYMARLAVGSRHAVAQRLRTVAGYLGAADPRDVPWHELRYEHIAAVRMRMQEAELAPATCNAMLSAVRGVLKESWRLGLMTRDEYERAQDIENVRGSRLHAGRVLTDTEIRKLLEVCMADETAAGARDAAMLAMMIGCGFRRAELASIAIEDVELHHTESSRVRVIGKGNKERLAYPPEGVVAHLRRWLERRGDGPGALFITTTKAGGIVPGHGISQATVYYTLAKRAAAAGISCSPHDLRRTFGTGLLRRHVDLATVQRLMGHASVATTTIYDLRGEAEDSRAAEQADVPLV